MTPEAVSYRVSLVVQVASLVLAVVSLALQAGKSSLLRVALVLEISANVVQLVWYMTIYSSTSIVRRYIDWFLTTPIMLISTVAVAEHFSSTNRSLSETLRANLVLLVFGLLFNQAMLAFGVTAELKFPRKSHRVRRLLLFFGCVCLLASFSLMITAFGYKTAAAVAIWATEFVIWSVYGVVALFVPKEHEATSYNVLDTVSKNVFSIVISVVLFSN
jgi:bacteriorhodopsin